jgi:mRNA-degrading endonuclease RelE of RelBE toxin-antitoxin system
MKVLQSRSFERKVKKLSPIQKAQLDVVIRSILQDPFCGEQKKGDLKDVFVLKFQIDKTLFLLAYSFDDEKMELIMLGPHENYYRELKNYLKNR